MQWRSALRSSQSESTSVAPVLFHQVKDPTHRTYWQQNLVKHPGRRTLLSWIGAGGYPGIWTVEDKTGWYSKSTAGKPIEFAMRKGFVLFDPDNATHRDVYSQWQANEAKLRGEKAPNRFDQVKNARGTPLSRNVAGIRAPKQERFYRELGVAGVAHYDTYGRKCVVLLNPTAVKKVRFNSRLAGSRGRQVSPPRVVRRPAVPAAMAPR